MTRTLGLAHTTPLGRQGTSSQGRSLEPLQVPGSVSQR
jgi:hypothetical protein